jgi:acetyl esterase/lipase
MRNFFAVLFIVFTGSLFAQKTEYITQTNLRYYPEAAYKNDAYAAERCVLDIYYPKGVKNFATIIWFHGGGLTEGSKYIPDALKNKGYCIIAIGYRLSPKVNGKTCIEDAAAAIAWVYKNIGSYGGDPSLIFVSGHSAGGYLGMMAVLDKTYLARYNVNADKIAGLIPFSGQCITHFTIRKEKSIPEKQPTIDEYAPLYHVRADAPPLLLITGDREMELLGRYEENAYMSRMMKVAGHKETRLIEIGGYGHQMEEPAIPILLNEVKRITDLSLQKQQ